MITSENIAASLVLPTLTLAIAMAAKYIRQIRAAVLEELNKDYVTGARARGVRGSVIIWKNVLRASMLTIVTLMALSVGCLLYTSGSWNDSCRYQCKGFLGPDCGKVYVSQACGDSGSGVRSL